MDMVHPLHEGRRLFLYLTDRCNCRCRHCYISKKTPSTEMQPMIVQNILKWFPNNKPKLILLGGEPTLYPYLEDVISYARKSGFRHIKIESNAGESYGAFASRTQLSGIDQVAFSVDGHNEIVYALTRGEGRFDTLIKNMEFTQMIGVRFYAILSISKINVHFASDILKFCKEMGCERVTIHYVTVRGDAFGDLEISPEEWTKCKEKIVCAAREVGILVKCEEGFKLKSQVRFEGNQNQCAVNFRENIMVMPNGYTFMCTMFLDRPDLASYHWDGRTFHQRISPTEIDICKDSNGTGCPGLEYTRTKLRLDNYLPICAFRKSVIR